MPPVTVENTLVLSFLLAGPMIYEIVWRLQNNRLSKCAEFLL